MSELLIDWKNWIAKPLTEKGRNAISNRNLSDSVDQAPLLAGRLFTRRFRHRYLNTALEEKTLRHRISGMTRSRRVSNYPNVSLPTVRREGVRTRLSSTLIDINWGWTGEFDVGE